jgi:hypothetical protein
VVSRHRHDLELVIGLAVLSALLVALLPSELVVLRGPAALALVFVLPGYALASAILPKTDVRVVERLLLSVALSIAATIFAALLLQFASVKETVGSWSLILAAVTVLAAVGGYARGNVRSIALPHVRIGRHEAAALVASVAILAGAAVLGFTPLGAPSHTAGTTALWTLPAPHKPDAVAVGAISDQLHTQRYVVDVDVDGRLRERFTKITLAPGATWTRTVTVGPGRPIVEVFLRTAAPNARLDQHTELARGWPGLGS